MQQKRCCFSTKPSLLLVHLSHSFPAWFSHSWSLLHSFFPSMHAMRVYSFECRVRVHKSVSSLFFVSDFCCIWIIFAFCHGFFFFFLFHLYSSKKFDIVKRKDGFETYIRLNWRVEMDRERGGERINAQTEINSFGLSHGPTGFLSL